MSNAEKYKRLALQLRVKARREVDPRVREELENLAECYCMLAQRNITGAGVASDTIPHGNVGG